MLKITKTTVDDVKKGLWYPGILIKIRSWEPSQPVIVSNWEVEATTEGRMSDVTTGHNEEETGGGSRRMPKHLKENILLILLSETLY